MNATNATYWEPTATAPVDRGTLCKLGVAFSEQGTLDAAGVPLGYPNCTYYRTGWFMGPPFGGGGDGDLTGMVPHLPRGAKMSIACNLFSLFTCALVVAAFMSNVKHRKFPQNLIMPVARSPPTSCPGPCQVSAARPVGTPQTELTPPLLLPGT